MNRHPPPGKEKAAPGAPTPERLVDGQTNTDMLTHNPLIRGPDSSFFILAQQADSDKVSSPFLVGWSVNAPGDYIPTDSHGQISARIIQTPTKTILVTLAALTIRERARFTAAGDIGDDEAFVSSFDRLLSLYAEHSKAREIEHVP